MTDLEVIPTDDLIEELVRRCDHLIVVGIRNGLKNPGEVISKRWSGCRIKCLGLTEVVKDFIMKDYDKEYIDTTQTEI